MKRIAISTALGLAVAAFPVSALADDKLAQEELKEHGCVKCHELDKKKVGPSYKDISAKYKGKKVDEVMAGMKGKPVHKSMLQKTGDASLKVMMEWMQKQ